MADQLDLTSFVRLRTSLSGSIDSDTAKKIEVACQSIHRWLKYCEYHYSNLPESDNRADLILDRLGKYRRKGESVEYRYVYEANIIGFLNSLHALLDSFPYLLNLVIPKFSNPNPTAIRWDAKFIEKYRGYAFYDELKAFMLEKAFNIVKSYVNTSKHKHLIRIANNRSSLEFEEFEAKLPVLAGSDNIYYLKELVPRQGAIQFLTECHDELVPKFFVLCRTIETSVGDSNSVAQ